MLLERDPRFRVNGDDVGGEGGVRLSSDGHFEQVGVVDEAAVVGEDVHLDGGVRQEPEVVERRRSSRHSHLRIRVSQLVLFIFSVRSAAHNNCR